MHLKTQNFLKTKRPGACRINNFWSCSAREDQRGFIALLSILMIDAVILVIALGLFTRSRSETAISIGEEYSYRALGTANLCAEEALMRLKSVLNYAGNETITIGSDSCSILAITGSGNTNRTVTTQSTIGGYTRKVKVVVSQISPAMTITSWHEVSDF